MPGRKTLSGIALSHPALTKKQHIENLLESCVGPSVNLSEMSDTPTLFKLYYGAVQESSDSIGSTNVVVLVQKVKSDDSSFGLGDIPILWLFSESASLLRQSLALASSMGRRQDLRFFRIDLGKVLSQVIFEERSIETRHVQLTRLLVRVPSSEAGECSILISASKDETLLRGGVLGVLKTMYKLQLRAIGTRFSLTETGRSIRIGLDGYGNVLVTNYVDKSRYKLLASFVANIATDRFILECDTAPSDRSNELFEIEGNVEVK